MLPDLEKLTDWVVANKRDKVFKDLTRDEIYNELKYSLDNNGLLVDLRDGKINGLLLLETRLHIKQLLTNRAGSAGLLTSMMRCLYPDMKVQAERRGKIKIYKQPDRAISKLVVKD